MYVCRRPSVNTQSHVATTATPTPDRSSGYVTDTAPVARRTNTIPAKSGRSPANRLSAAALPPPVDASEQQQLLQGWLQRAVTGAQAEKALRRFGEGRFCVRKSKSSADCVVLSLIGPNNVVHHHQFKKVRCCPLPRRLRRLLCVSLRMAHCLCNSPHSTSRLGLLAAIVHLFLVYFWVVDSRPTRKQEI